MGMTVKRRIDTPSVKRIIQHRLADIRGGVGVKTADLGGDFLFEGTPLGAPDAKGICSVVKFAQVNKNVTNSEVEIEVEKGHHFKIGDFVCAKEKGKAYAITAIDTNFNTKDIIKVGTTLGIAITKGAYLLESDKQYATDGSVLKVLPQSINGTGQRVNPKDNLVTDAWLIAVTKANALPLCIEERLKGIVNI